MTNNAFLICRRTWQNVYPRANKQVGGSRRSTYATKTRCATWFRIAVRRSMYKANGIPHVTKLCVELNYTGAAIGEMWGDLVIRHFVLEYFMLNRGFPRFRWESVCDRHVSCDRHDSCIYGFRQRRPCIDVQRTPIYVCIVSHVTVCLDGAHRKTILK